MLSKSLSSPESFQISPAHRHLSTFVFTNSWHLVSTLGNIFGCFEASDLALGLDRNYPASVPSPLLAGPLLAYEAHLCDLEKATTLKKAPLQ